MQVEAAITIVIRQLEKLTTDIDFEGADIDGKDPVAWAARNMAELTERGCYVHSRSPFKACAA